MIGYLKAQLLLSFFVSRETNTHLWSKLLFSSEWKVLPP